MNIELNTRSKQVAILLVLALIWGSSFILMKRGLESFSPEKVAQYRLFIAFLSLLPVALNQLRYFPKKRKEIIGLGIVALCGNLLPAFLFATAQTKLPSGIAGVLNSTVPLFTLIIGVLFFNVMSSWQRVGGIVIGLLGSALLIYSSNTDSNAGVPLVYPLMVVAATLCYATSVNTIKAVLGSLTALQITSFSFLLIGPIVGLGLIDSHFWRHALSEGEHSINLMYISALGILGTAGALLLFNQLVKFTSAVFASTVTYLIPIVALAWGFLDGEKLNIQQMMGMLVILLGVYLISKKSK